MFLLPYVSINSQVQRVRFYLLNKRFPRKHKSVFNFRHCIMPLRHCKGLDAWLAGMGWVKIRKK